MAINRSRMATVMEAVLEDLPRQRAAAQQRAEWEDQIRNYIQVQLASIAIRELASRDPCSTSANGG